MQAQSRFVAVRASRTRPPRPCGKWLRFYNASPVRASEATFWATGGGPVSELTRGQRSMKAVILAGGLGTRLSEETQLRPKPMVDVGGRPMLWHIMKIYSHHGISEFIICLGYKGYMIKEYFSNYSLHMSDVTFDFARNRLETHDHHVESWRVTLVDTGYGTMTGGRIKRVAGYIGNETFLLTYGDGVSDVDIAETIRMHRAHGKPATVTAIQPPGRFGRMNIEADMTISAFTEKPRGDGDWINGGFFVLEPSIFDRIAGDETVWEKEPLIQLARERQLYAYKHKGFWQCMDTLRDKHLLESYWSSGRAPWKVWPDGPNGDVQPRNTIPIAA